MMTHACSNRSVSSHPKSSLLQDGLDSAEMEIGGRKTLEAPVVATVIAVQDKVADMGLEIVG